MPSEDVSQWPENLRRKMERVEVAREDEEKGVQNRERMKITEVGDGGYRRKFGKDLFP